MAQHDEPRATNRELASAFTLVELLVVMGIMALLLTISIPAIHRQLHPDSMQKAVNDVLEACSHARTTAILSASPTELVIRPHDRVFSVAAGGSGAAPINTLSSPSVSGEEWRMGDQPAGGAGGKAGRAGSFSVTLSPAITIEGLGINGLDYTGDETAYVQFDPRGVSDEMNLILLSDRGERRQIYLEVVTGLAELEVDPNKFYGRDR
ncbi:MAG TPA: prepilin-type N-terminal cleavage/methylation domain-containing protein [Methylomirabilota bacterium]|nr:prepilin-type N-terminal cleavage/methylation domain-containing protein [Methylomirabilota bacterium]